MGTNTRVAMHNIAYREAVRKGPALVKVENKDVAAYTLTKQELAKLFEINGWSSDRIAWLKAIRSWRDYFDDIAPVDSILFNPGAEWVVMFRTVGGVEYHELEHFAASKQVRTYNVAPEIIVYPLDNAGVFQ